MAYDFSDRIQRGILFLLKSDKDFFQQIINLVKEDYFEFPTHGKIFSLVKAHYDKYKSLPNDEFLIESIRKNLGERELLSDYEDELEYINNIDKGSLKNKEFILDLIEDFSKQEAMKSAISESIGLIAEGRLEEVENLVRKALQVSRDVDVGQDYFSSVQERWERSFNKDHSLKYPTILPKLNHSLEGGLGPKELAMVIAPPGVGKSLYLVNQGVRQLIDGKKVLYVSLEMSEDKIAQRFDSVMTLVNQDRIKDPASQLIIKKRLDLFKESSGNSDLVIKEFPTSQASINTIRNLLVQLKNHNDFVPDVLIVDYLELLRPTREIQQEYLAQQRIAEELRGVGVENNILIWTATQTNRQGRSVVLIDDAQLGDSYGKIRTCDFAISLNQTEEEHDKGRMRVYVVKSRNGKTRFVVPMLVNYGTLRMDQDDDPYEK